MARNQMGAYWFGPPWIVAVILAAIPFSNWWLGFFHRLIKKDYIGAVLFFFFGAVLGFVDFFTILLSNKIFLFS